MKAKFVKAILLAIAGLAMVIFFIGCGKDPIPDNNGGGQKPTSPILGSVTISNVTGVSATIKVLITSTGGALITEGGVTLNGDANKVKTSSVSNTEFSVILVGLAPNTSYLIKGYAINSVGVSYSIETSFKTPIVNAPTSPILGSVTVSNVTGVSATIKVLVTSNGGSTITEGGVTLNGDANKVKAISVSDSEFSVILGSLTPNTVYLTKGYAINSVGVSYSIETSFKTLVVAPPYGVKDIDGNEYDTIRIGTQTWMAKNLNVKHYRDGSDIPLVTDNAAWANLTTGGMCYYDNDLSNGTIYGALYNWLTVEDTRGLAPAGWHIPSFTEWEDLWKYLGGIYVAGGHLKEVGTTHWLAPNYGADNNTGFTALPGGIRRESGLFVGKTEGAQWWSSTIQRAAICTYKDQNLDTQWLFDGDYGFSIRCIKNK